MRAEAFYGQGGNDQASSLLPGEQVKRGTVAKKIMAAPVVARAGDWQTRAVSADQKVKTTRGMRSRNGEGGTVPSRTAHPATK